MTRDAVRARPRRLRPASRGRLRFELRFTWLGGSRILDRVDRGRARHCCRHRPTLGVADRAGASLWRAARWHASARNGAQDQLLLLVPGPARPTSGARSSAVWDFCRAVDDAVDEEPAAGADCRPGATAVDASGARSWRACFDGGDAADAAGPAPAAVHSRRSTCRARRSRT